MSDGGIDELVDQIPISQLAGQLGVSDAEAEQAVRAALPALVGGLQANAADPAGAASLSRALGQHDGSLLDGGIDLGQVDTADGAKIVHNIFGANQDAVVDQLGGLPGGVDSGLIAKLLPMLAPLLLGFLTKKSTSSAGGAPSTSGMGPGSGSGQDAGGGGLGDLLGGLLGGGGGGGLGGLGDILGGLLGGGKR